MFVSTLCDLVLHATDWYKPQALLTLKHLCCSVVQDPIANCPGICLSVRRYSGKFVTLQ